MTPLDSESLRAIKDLISDPLVKQVDTSMRAGHDRLAVAIETVGRDLARHISATAAAASARDAEVRAMEARLGSLEQFKRRLAAIYTVAALILGSLWGLAFDWVKGELFPAKP